VTWHRWYADPATLGGHPDIVTSGTVNDPAARTPPEVDITVVG
jgi:hypothetical protein